MKIKETLDRMVQQKKDELAKKGGGPNPNTKMGAEATIVIKGPDGKVKGTHTANKTIINL